VAFVSNADSKLHLYHNQEETVYDHVFVRIVSDTDARITVAGRSTGANRQTAGIAIAVCVTECDAHAR
jgi:hypothetical protein